MDFDYNFELVTDLGPYISSRDKTMESPQILVKNSKNVYKKDSGTIANRPGLKAFGPLDATQNGVVSSFDWITSGSIERPIRVTKDGAVSVFYLNQWVQFIAPSANSRYIFDSWWDGNQEGDALIMVNGTDNIQYWPGGIAKIASITPSPGFITAVTINTGGTAYAVNDILQVTTGDGNALVQVTSVNTGSFNAVTGIAILNGGSSYSPSLNNPTVETSSIASGTGFTLNITTVATEYAIVKDTSDGLMTWASAGFYSPIPSNEVEAGTFYNGGLAAITIDGITYSYDGTGFDTNKLIIKSATPPAANPGDFALSSVETLNPNLGVLDVLKVIGNQVYLGSYTSRLIFASNGNDWSNYLVPEFPELGAPFFLVLDGCTTGIGNKGGVPVVFAGTNLYNEIEITTQNVNQGTNNPSFLQQVVTVNRIQTRYNSVPQAQEFIDGDGNYIVWLDRQNQVRIYGAGKDLFLSDRAPSLSQYVKDELKSVDFTGGALRWIDEFIYITAPKSATHYVYQERQYVNNEGAIKTEQIWNPPQICGISRFSVQNGVTYGYSNINPMTYQIWDTDQWHDDTPTGDQLPYECRMALAYWQLPGKGKSILRPSKIQFDKIYVEGYMSRGTPLYGTLYFDYQGATDNQTIYINTPKIPGIPAQPYPIKTASLYSYTTAPPLGQASLASNPLAEGITFSPDEQDYLPKFRAIRKVKIHAAFEIGLEIYSYDLDARWEIIAVGMNLAAAPQEPVSLQN